MRPAVGYLAGAGLLVLTFGFAYSTPDGSFVTGPIATRAEVGAEAETGKLAATIHEVALAHEVEFDGDRLTTAGVWMIVDVTLEGTTQRTLTQVDVFVGGERYSASGRADGTVDGGVVDAGFPRTGSVLVELPADIQTLPGAGRAVLRISPGLDTRLDGVIELVVDLTRLDVADTATRDAVRDGDA